MKQIKVFAGLTHHHVETEVNQWLAEHPHTQIENLFQSEWLGKEGRSFTITIFFDDKDKVKPAIPVQR